MNSEVKCYVDRIEGDKAVILIDGWELPVPRTLLPEDAAEGDHLVIALRVDDTAGRQTAEDITEIRGRISADDKD